MRACVCMRVQMHICIHVCICLCVNWYLGWYISLNDTFFFLHSLSTWYGKCLGYDNTSHKTYLILTFAEGHTAANHDNTTSLKVTHVLVMTILLLWLFVHQTVPIYFVVNIQTDKGAIWTLSAWWCLSNNKIFSLFSFFFFFLGGGHNKQWFKKMVLRKKCYLWKRLLLDHLVVFFFSYQLLLAHFKCKSLNDSHHTHTFCLSIFFVVVVSCLLTHCGQFILVCCKFMCD